MCTMPISWSWLNIISIIRYKENLHMCGLYNEIVPRRLHVTVDANMNFISLSEQNNS